MPYDLRICLIEADRLSNPKGNPHVKIAATLAECRKVFLNIFFRRTSAVCPADHALFGMRRAVIAVPTVQNFKLSPGGGAFYRSCFEKA